MTENFFAVNSERVAHAFDLMKDVDECPLVTQIT